MFVSHYGSRRTSLAILVSVALAASSSLFLALGAHADDADAKVLVQKTLEALPHVPFSAKVKLSGDVRGDRELAAKHKVVEGVRATYLEVTAPPHLVGVRFLFQERVGKPPLQYMRYVASTLPILVSDEMRAERFLGSTFYLADIAEPDINAFTFTFAGEETVGGRRVKLVEAVPVDPKKEVYGKVIHAIDPKDLVVVKRKFFDKKGKPIKEWTANKVEKVDGYWTVRDQTMKDLVGDEESRMEIVDIQYNATIDDAVFTKEYLGRK